MLNSTEFESLLQAVNRGERMNVIIDDSPSLTANAMRVKARRMVKAGVKLILIDYLQLMEAPDVTESRQQQITSISRAIKSIARELDVPIIANAQLNRATETRDGHRPRMSDLRESGSIEQDADVVMLLHREDYYKAVDKSDFDPDNKAEVIIAKQRNGPVGSVGLVFDKRCTTFRNAAAESPTMFK